MSKNQEPVHLPKKNGAGRVQQDREDAPSGKQDASLKDISEIDRQEGRMDHGELGGNFHTKNKAQEHEQGERTEERSAGEQAD